MTDGDIGGAWRKGYATDHIDFIANRGGHGRTSLNRHGRQSLPGIGGRIVLPSVVDRNPRRGAGRRIHESAERINLPVILRKRDVVRWKRHRLFLGPMIGGRIVFVDQSFRVPNRNKSSEDIHLSACRRAQNFLGGLWKWRELFPFGLRKSRRRRGAERNHRNGQLQPRENNLFESHDRPLIFGCAVLYNGLVHTASYSRIFHGTAVLAILHCEPFLIVDGRS